MPGSAVRFTGMRKSKEEFARTSLQKGYLGRVGAGNRQALSGWIKAERVGQSRQGSSVGNCFSVQIVGVQLHRTSLAPMGYQQQVVLAQKREGAHPVIVGEQHDRAAGGPVQHLKLVATRNREVTVARAEPCTRNRRRCAGQYPFDATV